MAKVEAINQIKRLFGVLKDLNLGDKDSEEYLKCAPRKIAPALTEAKPTNHNTFFFPIEYLT